MNDMTCLLTQQQLTGMMMCVQHVHQTCCEEWTHNLSTKRHPLFNGQEQPLYNGQLFDKEHPSLQWKLLYSGQPLYNGQLLYKDLIKTPRWSGHTLSGLPYQDTPYQDTPYIRTPKDIGHQLFIRTPEHNQDTHCLTRASSIRTCPCICSLTALTVDTTPAAVYKKPHTTN